MKKTFSIIGMDSFGIAIAKELKSLSQSIIVVDRDEEKLNPVIDIADHSAYGDITSETVLKDLGLSHVDHTIISLDNFEDAMLIMVILKELGTNQITVKINSDYQEKIAYKLGASLCVYPDRNVGTRIARKLLSNDILDYYNIDNVFGVYEIRVKTDKLRDSNLRDIDSRNRFGINIILIKRNNQTIFPSSDDTLLAGDTVIAVGKHDKFAKFQVILNE